MFKQISTRFNKFQHVSTNFNMTHSRDSISTQDSIEVLFSSLSLVSRHSSRIGYELYLADLPGVRRACTFFRVGLDNHPARFYSCPIPSRNKTQTQDPDAEWWSVGFVSLLLAIEQEVVVLYTVPYLFAFSFGSTSRVITKNNSSLRNTQTDLK